jgi:hypothetical protein
VAHSNASSCLHWAVWRCRKQPHIAQFERQLDERGQFESFKTAFQEVAGKPWDQIVAMTGKPAAWYITEPVKQEDALLDAKEGVLDKIRSFMSGAQREIYDDVRDFLQTQEANIG